jgi:hypothetical protein
MSTRPTANGAALSHGMPSGLHCLKQHFLSCRWRTFRMERLVEARCRRDGMCWSSSGVYTLTAAHRDCALSVQVEVEGILLAETCVLANTNISS